VVVWQICENASLEQVHTWDPSAWYAGRSWLLLALLAALAVHAFRISVAGRPTFRGASAERGGST
jgi:hypothetical protein